MQLRLRGACDTMRFVPSYPCAFFLAVLVAMGVDREASAGPGSGDERGLSSIELTYDVVSGCPSRDEFFELVRARQPPGQDGNAESRRRVAVVIRMDAPQNYTGRITSQEGDRAHLVREVSAVSCSEVADALAFIAAVSTDASTSAAPAPPPNAEDRSLTPPAAPAESPALHVVESTPSPGYAGALGADAEIVGLVGPEPILGFPIFLDVATRGDRALAPSFRLAFVSTLTVTQSNSVGSGHFRWTTGRLEVCPFRLSLASSLRARPCSRLDAGAVSASADLDGLANTPVRPWFAVALTGRVEWAIAGPIAAEIEAGATIPLSKDRFYFQTNTEVYRFGSAGPVLSAGIAARLW
jgi:hypothetical protein